MWRSLYKARAWRQKAKSEAARANLMKNGHDLAKWVKLQYQSDVNLKEGKPSKVPVKYIGILCNQLVGFPFKYTKFLRELRECVMGGTLAV